jgi:hypothetical protein
VTERAVAATGSAGRPLRFLWFGSYAKGPGYPRSETLIDGLRELGHQVTEVHAPLFDGVADRVRVGGGRGLVRGAWRQGRAALRLSAGWFRADEHDVVIVGSGGVVDAPLVRFLQNFDRRPVVLDAFIPLYDTAVRDRALAAEGSARARVLLGCERLAARLADLVLTDTQEHAALLSAVLGLAPSSLAVVPVAQADPGEPTALPGGKVLEVLLVSTFIPLHGVETVIGAAELLTDAPVRITLVGAGQGLEALRGRAEAAASLRLIPRFLTGDELRGHVQASHVGLGVFGTTPKAARVVPLKAALTLAAGRALVTRDGPAARAGLGDAAELVPAGDPAALAQCLRELATDRARVLALAERGRAHYLAHFTPTRAAEALLSGIDRACLMDALQSAE